MTYSVHERALLALLSVDDVEARQILSAFESLSQDPVGLATDKGRSRLGFLRYSFDIGRFSITYRLSASGRHMMISDVVFKRQSSAS